ncbi:ent-kaurenoic acid oxidase 1 [Setaria italica]|nr:ent-kaurenoic acid oxidase 1 [Setaria italica]
METMVAAHDQQAAWPWGCWWLALALLPLLLALAICHGNDAYHCAAFAFRRWRHGRPRAKLPPGHMGLPFVGENPALKRYFRRARRPDGFVHDKKRRYGDATGGLYRTHLFGSPAVLACSPAANKLVLQSPDSFGVCWPAPDLVGASSILNADGARHARLRACVIEAVNRPSSLRSIARAVQPRMASALRAWARRSTVTAAVETNFVTFENICKMFVGMDPSPLTEEMDAWFAGLLGGLRAFPLDLPGTAFRRALRCRHKLSAVFRDELRRRKDVADGGEDLMGALMRTEDEGGRLLSDEEVVDNIVSLVLAGYQSTASALMWAVYHLAKAPHALAKLREENAAIGRDKNGEFITPDDISKMKYTAKVVEETLRVANIAAMVHRVALKDVEYAGYTIPQGWRVVVWLRSLHMDPNYYDDPLRFNPDRWGKLAKPGTYQVFGGGYRMCAGNMLARLQLTILLHHLSVGYKWDLVNPDAEIIYIPHSYPSDGAVIAISEL